MAAEKLLEDKIRQFIASKGGYCEKIHGNEFQSGIADLLCCYKGRFIALEVKAPDGHASQLQIAKLKKVRKAGGIGEVIYRITQVEYILSCIDYGYIYMPGELK